MRSRSSQFWGVFGVLAFLSAAAAQARPKDDLDVRFRCYYFQHASKYLVVEILVDLEDRPAFASSTAVDGNSSSLPILIDLTGADESRSDVKYYRGKGFHLRVESRRTPVSNIPYFYGQLKWRQLDPQIAYGMTCTT